MKKRLENLRLKINKVDAKILKLIKERINIAKEIGQLKKESEMRIEHPEREASLLVMWQETAMELGLDQKLTESILHTLLKLSKNVQEKS